jgi:hypothetical protein
MATVISEIPSLALPPFRDKVTQTSTTYWAGPIAEIFQGAD